MKKIQFGARAFKIVSFAILGFMIFSFFFYVGNVEKARADETRHITRCDGTFQDGTPWQLNLIVSDIKDGRTLAIGETDSIIAEFEYPTGGAIAFGTETYYADTTGAVSVNPSEVTSRRAFFDVTGVSAGTGTLVITFRGLDQEHDMEAVECQTAPPISYTVTAPTPTLAWRDTGNGRDYFPHHNIPEPSFISGIGSRSGGGTDSWQMRVTGGAANYTVTLYYNPNNSGWVNLGSQGTTDSSGNLTFPSTAATIGDGAEGYYRYYVDVAGASSNEINAYIKDYDISASNVSIQQGNSGNIPVSVTNKMPSSSPFNENVLFQVVNNTCPTGWTCGSVNTTSSGNLPITIPSSAAAGDYSLTIEGRTPNSSGHHWRNTTVTVTVTAAPTPIPGWIAASPVCVGTSARINVSWASVTGATGYDLQKRIGSGSWNTVLLNSSATSYTDTSITSGTTYTYQVRAKGPGGDSGWRVSSSVTAIFCVGDITVNSSPVAGASYTLTRTGGGDGPISDITNAPTHTNREVGTWTISNIVPPSGYSVSSVSPGYTQNLPTNQTTRPSITFTINLTATPPPGAFTLDVPSPLCSGTSSRISLSWGSSSGATSYDVYRNGSLRASNVTSPWVDTTVTPGTSYTYFIRAINANGTTDSNSHTTTAIFCVGDITVNSSPTNATYTLTRTGGGTTSPVSATTNAPTHTNREVGTWTISNIVPPSGYSVSSVSPGYTQNLPTNQTTRPSITFIIIMDLDPPPPPLNLSADNSVCEEIRLTWTDNSNNEDGFHVWRYPSTGGSTVSYSGRTYSLIATKLPNVTSHIDTPPYNESYHYIVTSFNAGGDSIINSNNETGPIVNIECRPDLVGRKSIIEVNGGAPSGSMVNNGDTLRFRISFTNNGNYPAENISITDIMTSNLTYRGNATIRRGSTAPQSITGSASGQQIVFTGLDSLAPGPNWLVEFDAEVSSDSTQTIDFLENRATIFYTGPRPGQYSVLVFTGLVPILIDTTQVPDIVEVSP